MSKRQPYPGKKGVYLLASGGYQATWRDPSGRQRSKHFRTLKEAETYRASMQVSKDRGEYRDPGRGRTRLADYWREVTASSPNLSRSTRAQYEVMGRLHILPHLGGRTLASLTPRDVRDWITTLEQTANPPTIRAAHRALRRLLSVAVEDGILARNVAVKVGLPRVETKAMRVLSEDELAAVVDAAPERYRALVLLLGLCGLRIGEACALLVEDFDFLRRRVHVTKAVSEVGGKVEVGPTKTGKARSVVMPRVVADAVAAHLQAFPAERDGRVFTAPLGSVLRRTTFRRRVWVPTVKAAGLAAPLPRVHDLRHSAVALSIQAGAHPKAIQEMLGHSSITMTLGTYGSMFPTLAESVADRLDANMGSLVRGPDAVPLLSPVER